MDEKKAKGNSKEIYVIEVFGVPLIRKYVEVCSVEQPTSAVFGRPIKIFLIISMFLSILVPVTTSVYVLYYPPPVLRELADSFLEIYSTKGDVEELQKNLIVCEAEKRTINGNLGNFLSDYDKLNKEKENFRKMANELREEITKLEKREEVHQISEMALIQNLTLMTKTKLAVEQQLLTADDTIIKLEGIARKLGSRLSDLEKNLAESKKENNKLSQELSEAKETIGKMENNGKEEKEIIMKHNLEDKEEFQKNLITSERKLQQTKVEVSILEDDVKDLKKKLDIMTGEKVTITVKYKDSESKLGLCKNKIVDSESNSSKLSDELKHVKEESKNRATECQNNKEQLEAQLNSFINELEQSKKRFTALENSANNLKDNLNNTTKEKHALKEKVDDTEVMLGKCRNKNMDHEIEKSEIVKKLLKAERELKNCH